MTSSAPSPGAGALAGIRVLDLSRILGGPYCGQILGDHGADVLKVEPPGGDDTRTWGPPFRDGVASYYHGLNRNKRVQHLDLTLPADREKLLALVAEADVLIENFRPGAMEGWGLGPDALQAANPALVMLRISGYGQTGPYRDRPGFGVVAEAMGGLRHLTGEPGRVPVRVGVSIGDTLASLHGVIGILMALQHRHATVSTAYPKGRGQVIDVALYEAVFNCMESLLPEYSAFGAVREAAGSALPGIAPTNAYRCADGYVLIAGNGDSIFKRLMQCIGRPDLAADPQLADNTGRVAQVALLDGAIGDWAAGRTVAEVLAALEAAHVPAGRIYTVADIAADPHYAARGMLLPTRLDDGSEVLLPGFVPKLSATPAGHRRNAPALGADTDAVLREVGLSEAQIVALRERGVVG